MEIVASECDRCLHVAGRSGHWGEALNDVVCGLQCVQAS